MVEGYCTGCGRLFPVSLKTEAIIAEGKGEVKGYCAIVRQRKTLLIQDWR